MAAGFAPGWSETESLCWKYLGVLRRYRIFVMHLDLNLNVTNTVWCGKHVKNCELQNVFKIYNWWLQRQK